MAVKELNEIYGEVGRNLDNQIDENTLVAGETGTRTFGAFKFFSGIAKFLAGSAKKIIKGGASVEGGLAVDSLTVNGSKGISEQTLLNTLLMTDLDPDKAAVKFWKGNADNAPEGTVNCIGSSTTNLPYDIGYWFFLTTHYHCYSQDYAWQMAAMMTGGDSVYIRIKENGVWHGWTTLTVDRDTGWVSVNPIMRYRIRSNLCTIKIEGAYRSSYVFNLPFQPLGNFATTLFWGAKVQGYMSIISEGNVSINDVAENELIYCDFTFPIN